MALGITELEFELARQQAIALIFDEFQIVPERSMEVTDFKRIRANWVVVMTNPELPDLLVIVEYDSRPPGQTHVHLYQRRTRTTHTARTEPANSSER